VNIRIHGATIKKSLILSLPLTPVSQTEVQFVIKLMFIYSQGSSFQVVQRKLRTVKILWRNGKSC